MVLGSVEANLDTCRRLVTGQLWNPQFKEATRAGAVGKYGNALLDSGLQYFSRLDTQLLHAGDQGRALDVHACCGAVRACYSPVRDFQDADNLIALIGFARIHHRNGPAIIGQFTDRGFERRAMGKDH